jgi:hypothetical protein
LKRCPLGKSSSSIEYSTRPESRKKKLLKVSSTRIRYRSVYLHAARSVSTFYILTFSSQTHCSTVASQYAGNYVMKTPEFPLSRTITTMLSSKETEVICSAWRRSSGSPITKWIHETLHSLHIVSSYSLTEILPSTPIGPKSCQYICNTLNPDEDKFRSSIRNRFPTVLRIASG